MFTKFNRPILINVFVISAFSILIAIGIPIYITFIKRSNVTQITNKLYTFKLPLIEIKRSSGVWPANINSVLLGNTADDSFFTQTEKFRYNARENKAWVGYQLNADYGSGWIFMLITANSDHSFDILCGSMDMTCAFGSCNSGKFYPQHCNEFDIGTRSSLNKELI